MSNKSNQDYVKRIGQAAQLSSVPFEFGLCVWIGYWVDEKWATSPLYTTIGCVVGLAVSLTHLWSLVRAIQRDSGSSSGNSE